LTAPPQIYLVVVADGEGAYGSGAGNGPPVALDRPSAGHLIEPRLSTPVSNRNKKSPTARITLEDPMSEKTTTATETKTAEVKSPIEQMMGAWAMPKMGEMPGAEAFQAATKQQVDQLEKMLDEYTKHETKAMEQARNWMTEMTRLNQASMEYALSLQAESRKLWRQQLHQVASQVGTVKN
jgi:hypothetical protein